MVDVAPDVDDVNLNAASCASYVTVPPRDVKAAWMIVAAFEKLVAAVRVMALDVLAVPSIDTVRMPASAFSSVSVMDASEPPRRYAATGALGYCANSRLPGFFVELSKPRKYEAATAASGDVGPKKRETSSGVAKL
ncbi:hypothetical protein D3C86_1346870 [compost metagenome]